MRPPRTRQSWITALRCKEDEMLSIGLLLFVWGSWFFICGLLVNLPTLTHSVKLDCFAP